MVSVAAAVQKPVESFKLSVCGPIPVDWGASRIGDLTIKVGSGKTPTGGNRVYRQSGRPFVRSQNIGWGVLLLDDLAYIDEDTHASFRETELHLGDVLLNITGASIGRCSISDGRILGGNVNQHVCIIRTDQTLYDASLMMHVLLSEIGQKQIDAFQAGGNREGLNFGQVRSIVCPVPASLREQRAIAEALSEADALIEELERLILKKRAIKQGVMQDLLSGRRRLPGFSAPWQPRTLGELYDFKNGLNKEKKFFGYGTPIINYMDVYSWPRLSVDQLQGKVTVTAGEADNFSARRGDVFFTRTSETVEEIGLAAALTEDIDRAVFSGFVLRARPRTNELYGPLAGYLLRSPLVRRQIVASASYTTRALTNGRLLSKVDLLVPVHDEQIEIAAAIDALEQELTGLGEKLDKARQVKQGMMQELLSGRVRLV